MSQFADNSTGVTLNQATFGLSILFIFVAFIQLVITAVYGFSSKHRRGLHARHTDREPEHEEPAEFSRHRQSFTILMMMALLMLIISFAFNAATFCVSFDVIVGFWYELSRLVREMSTEFFYAGLLMFLACCEYATEDWNVTDSDFARFSKSTARRSIMFPLVLVFIMVASTITRLVLFIVHQVTSRSAWLLLASFITLQIYMLAYLILTIYFGVTAVKAWRRGKPDLSFVPLDLSNGHVTFDPNDMLRRIAHYICPLLCVLTAYEIVYDVLQFLVAIRLEDWLLANTVVEGVVLLLVTTIAVTTGLMSRD
ncbi:hypothetical protein APHAL10511_000801 [Amanita phalloides]|nr:hypothetical protein APHAL10511_000801 [Amanita phalloides]